MTQIGDRIGRITVMGKDGRRTLPSGQAVTRWVCQCSCGKMVIKVPSQLAPSRTKHEVSCGCSRIGKARSHGMGGMSRPPEYEVWRAMRRRCRNEKCPDYKYYGARGISICERWEDFQTFYADMGSRPSDDHSIDRIDVDGPYSPENCRWATPIEQRNNQRRVLAA